MDIDRSLTPAQLREMAHKCHQSRIESEIRSDTDGFLSQWADSITANVYELEAEIREDGGVSSFAGLYSRSNPDYRIPAKLIETRYGMAWAVLDPSTRKFTGEFIKAHMTERGERKHNVIERPELAPARADIVGRGRGLSGRAWAAVLRTDGGWSPNLKPQHQED